MALEDAKTQVDAAFSRPDHRGLAFEDIDLLLDRLSIHYRRALSAAGTTPSGLRRASMAMTMPV